MNPGSDFSIAFSGFLLLRPLWLLALLPLGLLLWHLARTRDDAASGWQAVVDARLLPHLIAAAPPRRRRAALAMLGTGLLAAVVALSGPALPGKSDLAFRRDATRVLVVDLSPALAGQDGAAPRLERLRLKLLELLRAMPDGQTALIAYAEEPYLVAPLTTDAATLALLVPELAPDALPLAGERPERALRMAEDLLRRSGSGARDVLWITATTSPTPAALQLAGEFRTHGIRLSVLQLATSPADALGGLRGAAHDSGGLHLALRPDDDDVRELAALFATAPATTHDGERGSGTPHDLGPWLLPLLLPLAALAFRRGVLLVFALPLLLQPPPADAGDIAAWWSSRPDRRALRFLQAGDPDAAARHFTDPRWQAVAHYRAGRHAAAAEALAPFADADSLYNRGTALARLNRLPEALQALEAALHLRPDDSDFRHNRDLVRELLDRKGNPPEPDANDGASGGRPEPSPPGASVATPPPPSATGPSEPSRGRSDPEREAGLLAEQWLRRVPDEPAGLLRGKLLLEHQRRQSGEAARPWQ